MILYRYPHPSFNPLLGIYLSVKPGSGQFHFMVAGFGFIYRYINRREQHLIGYTPWFTFGKVTLHAPNA